MYIWHKETTPGTTGARCTIRDGSGLFVAECIASDAAAIVEAPAMLAALRATVALCELHIAERSADPEEEGNFLSCAYLVNARAILARIDGTPTDEAAETCETCGFAPRPAPTDDSCDCGPTAQPDLAAALADLFERGSWHDDGSFVYWPDDSEPDNEGAIFTLSDIHNRHTT